MRAPLLSVWEGPGWQAGRSASAGQPGLAVWSSLGMWSSQPTSALRPPIPAERASAHQSPPPRPPLRSADCGAASYLGDVCAALRVAAGEGRWTLEAVPRPHLPHEAALAAGTPHELDPVRLPVQPPVEVPSGAHPALVSSPTSQPAAFLALLGRGAAPPRRCRAARPADPPPSLGPHAHTPPNTTPPCSPCLPGRGARARRVPGARHAAPAGRCRHTRRAAGNRGLGCL
jgi:hypothetical protein